MDLKIGIVGDQLRLQALGDLRQDRIVAVGGGDGVDGLARRLEVAFAQFLRGCGGGGGKAGEHDGHERVSDRCQKHLVIPFWTAGRIGDRPVFRSWHSQFAHASLARDDGQRGHGHEQAVLDHAGDGVQVARQRLWVRNVAE